MRYTDHEQRQMDIKSGDELDRRAQNREQSTRYKVKALYGFNSVIKGFVEATSPLEAIMKAEASGILQGTDDADDWVAIPAPKSQPSR